MTNDDIYSIIGYIDSYGAIHHQPLTLNTQNKTHEYYWPLQTHKTWRFNVSEWQLENSILSKDNLTSEEAENVYAFLRKHYTPPLWVIKGEEWDALGRPRSGAAYKKHCDKWDAIYNLKKSS